MDEEKIRALLHGRGYENVFAIVRKRVEQGGLTAAKTVRFVELTDDERSLLGGLLGRSVALSGPLVVKLADLDEALRESGVEASLEAVLIALGGPLSNRRVQRAAKRMSRDVIYARAGAHPALAARAELAGWLNEIRASGLAVRAAKHFDGDESAVLDRVMAAVGALPAEGVLLPVFAARLTGDAHSYDAGRLLGTIVLRAAQRLAHWERPPTSADERRKLWAAVGVDCDALSADLLALRVALVGDDPLSQRLRIANLAGDPTRVTLWDIERHGVKPGAITELFIVENPAIVAASALRTGATGPAMISVEGVPSTAAWRFLHAMKVAGVRLRFHCDFDWGGVRIGNLLVERAGAEPWLMSAEDYEKALDGIDEPATLEGAPETAAWDPRLGSVLSARKHAVFEEQILERLLVGMS